VREHRISTTSENRCHELPTLGNQPRRQRVDTLVNSVEATDEQPLMDRLHRQTEPFKLLQGDQPVLPEADPCDFSITPMLMGRKLHSCLSFRPINGGGF
jgi:hypothetical protein